MAANARQAELHTALPGIIRSYDAGTMRASVQIRTKRKHVQPIIGNNDGNVEIPELLDLPVHQPFAGRLYLGFEPKPGDECMVIFAERSIASAKSQQGTYDLDDARMHNLSDGVVIPFSISTASAGDVTGGVSLFQCFRDLIDIVETLALSRTIPPAPAEVALLAAMKIKIGAVL